MATGVVVLAIGRATRLIRYVQDLEKEYVAVARFGVATDTLDADGSILSREPMDFGRRDLEGVIPRFSGTVMQVPPMVSALKVGGRRLYELAREGADIERQPRPVEIHSLDVLDFAPGPYPEVTFRVVCGKGTYVRVIADDIAAALGGRAHLISLRRLRTGSFDVEEHGLRPEDLDRWRTSLISAGDGLSHIPAMSVDEEMARAVSNGVRIVRSAMPVESERLRLVGPDGALLAIYRVDGPSIIPEVVLA